MSSDGRCFVCREHIQQNDLGMRSVEFIGDSTFEPGRYAAHMACTTGLRHQWLTRDIHGTLVPLTPKNAPKPLPWYRKIVARFFAWGATKFQPQRRFE